MKTLRETHIDLIYMVSRKRQDILSELEAWGTYKRVEKEGRGREVSRKKCITSWDSLISRTSPAGKNPGLLPQLP